MPHKKLNDIFKLIKDDYDFVIINTPPSTGLSLHMALFASDMMNIVTDKVKKSNIHSVYIEAIANLAVTENIVKDSTFLKESQSLHIPLIEYKNEFR